MELSKVWFYDSFKRLSAIRFESHFGKRAKTLGFSLSLGRDTEDTFQFMFGLPFLFLIYLTFNFQPWAWWMKALGKAKDRDIIRIHFCDQYINLALWHDTYDHTKGELNGWSYISTWKDVLCGDWFVDNKPMGQSVYEQAAVSHLDEPNGIRYAKWRVSMAATTVIYKRWYMRLWTKFRPQVYHTFCVVPLFDAAYPGKNGKDSLNYLSVTTVNTPKEAIDVFNERLTELQTRY